MVREYKPVEPGRLTVHIPAELALRCRRLQALLGPGLDFTLGRLVVRAVSLGLDHVQNEVLESARRLVVEHDPEGL